MEIDTNDIFPWRDEEGSEEESSKSPAMALQPDLREALETDLASFSLYAAMNYTSGVEECESRLMRTLRLATVALEANPSPRSLSLLLTSCRALYALAHRYNRPGIKILCADAMMGTEARWRWTMRACGESNTAAEEQESKQVCVLQLYEHIYHADVFGRLRLRPWGVQRMMLLDLLVKLKV